MLLAHKANVEAQDEVSDFIGFDNNDFVGCHLILNNVFVFHSIKKPPYIMPVGKATRRLFQCCWPTKRMCMLRIR